MKSLQVFDRKNGTLFEEKILGEKGIRFLYENPFGRFLESFFLSRSWFSKLYGSYQNSSQSSKAIPAFVRDFGITMEDFDEGPFRSFNDFFIRKLKPGARPFETEPTRFPAPAEGRYLFFESIGTSTPLPVKGALLNGPALLGNAPWASQFNGGPGFIARLCPVDYHRFHFPDAGSILTEQREAGPLHSVNPIALSARGDLLFKNERQISLLETENFGKIAYVEVGAICVGKIVQTHSKKSFTRGDEKGYFLFGGSTVIVIAEPGRVRFDEDLIQRSCSGIETLIRLGEAIGTRV